MLPSMRVITFNANGIRAAARKGFFEWLDQQAADVVCIQETKAQEEQLTDPVFHPEGYHCAYADAEKKGYSGTAIYSRVKPNVVQIGLDWPPIDMEGRWLQYEFDDISIASLYMPSGTSGEERQAVKYQVMDYLSPYLKSMAKEQREWIVCADWNIVHTEKDIKNWKSNQKNSGCLPEERAWLDKLFGEWGMVDAFRVVEDRDQQYTWWSNRGQAWANNTGWRIDYHVVSPGLQKFVRQASVYRDERFSDHAPLIIDYDFQLK